MGLVGAHRQVFPFRCQNTCERQFIYISHFLEEEMGRGRGWLHCAFSCSVSADGSCWAPCCIPVAPHHCLMARGQSIVNETSQLHGALPLPRPLCCWPTQSHACPFIPSPTTGLSMARQAAAGGPPSAQVELGLQPLVAGWDVKLPDFIPEGF